MTKKKVSAQLKKARKLIEKGWARGTFFTVNYLSGVECYCSIGAINKVVIDNAYGNNMSVVSVEDKQLLYKCIAYLGNQAEVKSIPRNDPYSRVIAYNDRPRSTKNKVLEMYDKAIAKAIEDETSS